MEEWFAFVFRFHLVLLLLSVRIISIGCSKIIGHIPMQNSVVQSIRHSPHVAMGHFNEASEFVSKYT